MANLYELTAEKRETQGKAASRRLRRIESKMPAVVYGAGKDPMSILIDHNQIYNALKNETFYSHILTLSINGESEKVVLKDLQRHASKPQVVHADFMRVSATEKLYMTIPFNFIGEDVAPGVKMDDGIISHLMNEVEIRCLPADLPEYIDVEVTNLGINETIHLSDLKPPKGVEIVALISGKEQDQPIVNIHKHQEIVEPEEIIAPPAEVPTISDQEKAAAESEEKE
jgi:large subunit ribosomal protein L25